MQNTMGDVKAYSIAGTQQEVRFIASVLNLPDHSCILDSYCGYGGHAIGLAKLGFNVTGVDATQDFLDIAIQKAKDENANIRFQRCDIRKIEYIEQFDAVINMFSAFGYFTDEENAVVLRLLNRSLTYKGLLLIDLLNREWMVHNNLNRYWRHPGGEYVLSYKIELRHGLAIMKRQLINQVTGTKTQYEFMLRAYSLAEITSILLQNGFQVKAAYGGFEEQAYGPESPRMIILAQKENDC